MSKRGALGMGSGRFGLRGRRLRNGWLSRWRKRIPSGWERSRLYLRQRMGRHRVKYDRNLLSLNQMKMKLQPLLCMAPMHNNLCLYA